MRLLFCFLLACQPLVLFSQPSNVLIYTDPVQVSSSINSYENLVAEKPIQGTIMITHQSTVQIDAGSFRMGDKSIQVEFVSSTPMSSFSDLVVTIYQFQLNNIPKGSQTLPPIQVNVGGKTYQAPPLEIQVAG